MARKRITWTAEPQLKRQRLPPYFPNRPFSNPAYEELCTLGSLWLTADNCAISNTPDASRWATGGIDPHQGNEYCYIIPVLYGRITFPRGSLAIFAGTTRVSESKGNSVVEILRPTFIVNGIRVLAANLDIFLPLPDTARIVEGNLP